MVVRGAEVGLEQVGAIRSLTARRSRGRGACCRGHVRGGDGTRLRQARDRPGRRQWVVAKRLRRLGVIGELMISLTAKGLTTREVCAHLAAVYGAQLSKDHISTITDRVLERPTLRPASV